MRSVSVCTLISGKGIVRVFTVLAILSMAACTGGGDTGYEPPFYQPPSGPGGGPRLRPRRVRPIFGFQRAQIPTLPSLPQRKKAPSQPPKVKPENYTAFQKNINSCVKKYEDQWKRTEAILQNLDAEGPDCWNHDQREEVKELSDSIEKYLVELRKHRVKAQPDKTETDFSYDQLKALTEDYNEVQENLSYCRLYEITHEDPLARNLDVGTSREDDVFGNIQGQTFIDGTGLKQNDLNAKMLDVRQGVYGRILMATRHSYIQDQRQAEPCFDVPQVYQIKDDEISPPFPDLDRKTVEKMIVQGEMAQELLQAFQVSMPSFRHVLMDKLGRLNLRDIDSLYFLAGTLTQTVVYQITLQDDGNYTFRIFNSGKGSDYHTTVLNGVKTTLFPFVERTGVSREKIQSPVFLKAIRDLAYQDFGKGSNSEPEHLYDRILQEAGGTITTRPVHVEDFLDPRMPGTEHYYELPYYHTATLGDKRWGAHLEFLIRASSLESYMTRNQDRFFKENHTYRLARKGLTTFMAEVGTGLEENDSYLDHGMARQVDDRFVGFYQKWLDAAREFELAELDRNTSEYDLEDGSAFKSRENRNPEVRSLLEGYNGAANVASFTTVEIESWNPDEKSLSPDLERLINSVSLRTFYSESPSPEQNTFERFRGVQAIARKLPLDEPYWKNLSNNDLKATLALLDRMSRIYVSMIFKLVDRDEIPLFERRRYKDSKKVDYIERFLKRGLSSSDLLAQIKLLTVADVLVREYGSRKGKDNQIFANFPGLYQDFLEDFVVGRTAPDTRLSEPGYTTQWALAMTLKDAEWRDQFIAMQRYWTNHKIELPSFFGFERFPLYGQPTGGGDERHICVPGKDCKDLFHWSGRYADPKWSDPEKPENPQGWPDLRWVRNLMNQGLVRPDGKGDRIRQALNLMETGLPEEYTHLRTIAFITHYLGVGSLSVKAIRPFKSGDVLGNALSHVLRFDMGWLEDEHGNKRVDKEGHWIFGTFDPPKKAYFQRYQYFGTGINLLPKEGKGKDNQREESIENPTVKLDLNRERARQKTLGPISERQENNVHYDQPLSIPYHSRKTIAEIVALPNQPDPGMTLELTRKVESLNSVVKVLAFFRENPYYLRLRKWQVFFKSLVFQPGLIEHDISRTPGFPAIFSRFCLDHFQRNREDKDYETAIFFLRMNHLFNELTRKAGVGNRDAFDSRNIYRELLEKDLPPQLKERSVIKNLISRDLIRTFLYEDFSKTSNSDIALYLFAQSYRNEFPLSRVVEDKRTNEEREAAEIEAAMKDEEWKPPVRDEYEVEEENEIQGIHILKLDSIKKRLVNSIGSVDDVFNEVGSLYHVSDPIVGWRQKGDRYSPNPLAWVAQGPGGLKVLVDLTQPKIYVGGRELNLLGLSDRILGDLAFRRFVDLKEMNPPLNLGGNVYEIRGVKKHKGQEVPVFRVSDRFGTVVIQKKWAGRWYQYISDSEVSDSLFQDWSITPGYDNWILFSEEDRSTSKNIFAGLFSSAPSKAEGPYRDWVSLSPNESEIIATDPHSNRIFSVSRVKSKGYTGGELTVRKLAADGTLGDFLDPNLADNADSPVSLFRRFEVSRYIWVWRDFKNPERIKEVDLPRFGLHFVVNSENRLISKENENFALAQRQTLPGWESNTHFLLLEKGEEKRVLFPRFSYRHLGSSFLMKLEMNTRSDEFARRGQRYFMYPVDPLNGALIYQNQEARFYLAYLYLWNHEDDVSSYDRARSNFYGSGSELGLFSEREKEILDWIWNGDNSDFDPRAIAIRLGAASVIVKNLRLNNQEEAPRFEWGAPSVAGLYHRYLRVKDKISSRWLPENLELWILGELIRTLDSTSSGYSNLVARWKELRGEELGKVVITSGKQVKDSNLFYNQSNITTIFEDINTMKNMGASGSQNVYQVGIPFSSSDFDEHYRMAYNFRSSSIEGSLRDLLGKSLGPDAPSLTGLSLPQLREEYLSYLRLNLRNSEGRGGNEDAKKMGSFLYILCTTENRGLLPSPGEYNHWYRYTLRDPVEAGRVRDRIRRERRDSWEAYSEYNAEVSLRQRAYESSSFHQNLIALGQNLTPLPKQAFVAPVRVMNPTAQASPSKFIDPFLNKSFSLERPIVYGVEKEAEEHDLRKRAVIPPAEMEKYIVQQNISAGRMKAATDLNRELAEIFQKPFVPEAHDPFILEYLGGIVHQIHEQGQVENAKKAYQLAGRSSISDLNDLKKNILIPKLQDVNQRAADLAKEITLLANKIPESQWGKMERDLMRQQNLHRNAREGVLRRVLLEGAIEEHTRLETLIQHYGNRAIQDLFDVNRNLDSADIDQLMTKLTTYLTLATYGFKVKEVIQGVESLEKSFADKSLTDESREEELRVFYTKSTQLRTYDLIEYPEYLAFEYFQRILIRPDQIANLELLNITKRQKADPSARGKILEMIMGAGKTSVFVPLLSHFNARPDQLSIIILPEALLPDMIKQISAQLGRTFDQAVDRLTIQRRDHYNLEKLQRLYDRLRDDLARGKVIVTSNSSIQSLFLIFIERLYDEMKLEFGSNAEAEFKVLQDIFWIFRNFGYVTIDEVDLILDIMTSHRFSMGKAEHIEDDIVWATAGLYSILVDTPGITEKVKIPFLDRFGTNAESFTKEAYHRVIKPRLIERICEENNGKRFFKTVKPSKVFDALSRKELRSYLESTDPVAMNQYIESISDVGVRNAISVLYTQVQQTLPLTLSKLFRVHYGLFPASKCREDEKFCPEYIGIPYHNGTPVDLSRFGTDLESLNYTFQSHIELKDSLKLLTLKHQVLAEKLKTKKTDDVRDEIRKFFGNISDDEFFVMSDRLKAEKAEGVNKQPLLLLELARSFAIPQIHVYPNQLHTNSHIYPIIFKLPQGVTGTLGSWRSFPAFYEEPPILSDTLGRTLSVLFRTTKDRGISIFHPDQMDTVDDIVHKIVDGTQSESIIDLGGILRGKSNALVAHALLSAYDPRSPIKNIVYYDEKHETQLYNAAEGTKPYIAFNTDRNQTAAYWDMQHTTGSDLKVHPRMKAVLTVNRFSTVRDIMQAAWRLRDLEINQKVSFMVPHEDMMAMSKFLVEFYGPTEAVDEKNFTVQKLFLYLATNEAVISGELNFRSLKGAQRNIVIDQVFDFMIDKKVNATGTGTTSGEAFDYVRSFFDNPRDPLIYKRYGSPVVKSDTLTFLRAEISRLFGRVKAFFKNSAQLEQSFERILDLGKGRVRKYVMAPPREAVEPDSEMEVELEMELEQEQEQEQEQQPQVPSYKAPAPFRKMAIAWNRNSFFDGTYLTHPTSASEIPNIGTPSKPTIKMGDVLTLMGKDHLQRKLSPKLLASLNLFPVFNEGGKKDNKFAPFGLHQAAIDEGVLILKDEVPESFIMMNRDEAFEIGDWIQEHQDKSVADDGKEYAFLVYQFGNGFIRYSDNISKDRTEDELRKFLKKLAKDPAFLELEVQAKFLSGRVSYEKKEWDPLKKWLQGGEDGGHEWMEFFTKEILKFKDTTRVEEFENSDLHRIFRELDLMH